MDNLNDKKETPDYYRSIEKEPYSVTRLVGDFVISLTAFVDREKALNFYESLSVYNSEEYIVFELSDNSEENGLPERIRTIDRELITPEEIEGFLEKVVP